MKQALRIVASLLAVGAGISMLWAGGIFFAPVSELVEEDWAYAQPRSEQENYIIYSAIIAGYYVPRGTNLVVINGQTSIDTGEEIRDETAELRDHLRTMTDPGVVDDFYSRNNEPDALAYQFALPVDYKIIRSKELRQYSQDDDGMWEVFPKQYPKSFGLITLSRIGLSRNSDRALVYVERNCGPLCGTGKYFSLQKQNGSWRVLQEYMRWIS